MRHKARVAAHTVLCWSTADSTQYAVNGSRHVHSDRHFDVSLLVSKNQPLHFRNKKPSIFHYYFFSQKNGILLQQNVVTDGKKCSYALMSIIETIVQWFMFIQNFRQAFNLWIIGRYFFLVFFVTAEFANLELWNGRVFPSGRWKDRGFCRNRFLFRDPDVTFTINLRRSGPLTTNRPWYTAQQPFLRLKVVSLSFHHSQFSSVR